MNHKQGQNGGATKTVSSPKCMEHSVWHWLSTITIWGTILLFVAVTGMACGARLATYGGNWNRIGMMNGNRYASSDSFEKNDFQKGRGNMMLKYKKEDDSTNLFGVVSKVEKNLITIMDNSSNEQVVVSLSGTTIVSATGEVGLASIKEGQSLKVVGTMNADKQLEAQIIRVL